MASKISMYNKIFEAVETVPDFDNLHGGIKNDQESLYELPGIEVNPQITITQAHQIACCGGKSIKLYRHYLLVS